MHDLATKYLKEAYGKDAYFRNGQLEAILSVLENNGELVVQQTGWGKSLVYFILTKIYRSENNGPTIIISPLLSLVRNQILSAKKFNLTAVSLSSDNRDEWDNNYQVIKDNKADIIFLTPEHLANKENMTKLYENLDKKFSLLVIDEAHCISDWGHDFRPDYKKIVSFIKELGYKIPVLATTATANDRVIDDIMEQLNIVNTSRGPLVRESLRIQVLNINTRVDRYAWILGYLKKTNKNGIIYCLTQKDTEDLNRFLLNNKINSAAYNAASIDRVEVEERFLNNDLKVVVATIALGMGYDKSDIGFVIHYQRPGNIVAYYQQIGRAGRSLAEADVIMLNGPEDEIIQKHFIDDAFPKVDDIEDVKKIIVSLGYETFKVFEIQKLLNIKKTKLDQILKYLVDNNVIGYDRGIYNVININEELDYDLFSRITKVRYAELDEMKQFIKLKTCYMKFLATGLSDNNATDCGKCANCLGMEIYSSTIDPYDLESSTNFVNNLKYMIEPRKQLPIGVKYQEISRLKTKNKDYTNELGYSLTYMNEGNLGQVVKQELATNKFISEEVVEDLANLIESNVEFDSTFIVTHVPSNSNNDVLKDLATRVAEILDLEYRELINKVPYAINQKELNNNYKLFENSISSYSIKEKIDSNNIILIDDFIQSKWTLTSIGLKLTLAGASKVYPFTLTTLTNY